MTSDQIAEQVAEEAIASIERLTLEHGIVLSACAVICREVAMELRGRADMFEDEAGEDDED